jgi:hypothetical protein
MRAVPFGRTGIGHRLHHLIFGTKRRGAAFGFRANAAKRLESTASHIIGYNGAKGIDVAGFAPARY